METGLQFNCQFSQNFSFHEKLKIGTFSWKPYIDVPEPTSLGIGFTFDKKKQENVLMLSFGL